MATRLLGAKLNLLSARDVLNARDEELSDGGGLVLRCSGTSAAWVFRYTGATGKRREMGLGACARHNARAAGESLALARNLAAKQRALLAAVPPLDPIDERNKAAAARREAERQSKAEKQQEKATLARVSRLYHEKFIEPKRHPKRSADWINSLENHVPTALWHKPIAEITRPELLEFLRNIQGRMADTGQQVRRRLDEVFEEAVEQGASSVNLVALLHAKLRREHKPKRVTPHEALAFAEAPAFVGGLRTQPGIAARCLEFTIYTAARTGESIGAKAGEPHTVHLSHLGKRDSSCPARRDRGVPRAPGRRQDSGCLQSRTVCWRAP